MRSKKEINQRLKEYLQAFNIAKEMHDTASYLRLRAEIKVLEWVLE